MKTIYFLSIILLFTNCKTSKLGITQINFTAGGCFGTCPIFKMTIVDDGTATYDAIRFNKKQGQFKTTIQKVQLDSLNDLLTKADFFNLNNEYSINVTDHPTYTLAITLKNGQTKKIVDYGPSGPQELRLVYKKIFSLRESEDWK